MGGAPWVHTIGQPYKWKCSTMSSHCRRPDQTKYLGGRSRNSMMSRSMIAVAAFVNGETKKAQISFEEVALYLLEYSSITDGYMNPY